MCQCVSVCVCVSVGGVEVLVCQGVRVSGSQCGSVYVQCQETTGEDVGHTHEQMDDRHL